MKTEFETYKQSFRINNRFLYTLIYDLLLFLLFFISIRLWQYSAERIFPKINTPGFSGNYLRDSVALQQISSSAVSELTNFLSITLLIFISFFIIFSTIKYLIWNIVLKEKNKIRNWIRFLLLNTLWSVITFLILLIPMTSMFKTMEKSGGVANDALAFQASIFWILIILFAYLTPILYVLFIKNKRLFFSLKKTFLLGILRIRYFIFPYLLIILTLITISIVLMITKLFPQIVQSIFGYVTLFAFIAWIRFYISKIILKLS